jgi:hypothetical protein
MENSQTQSLINEREQIMSAASWKSESENPEFGDNVYRSFIQVMTYRREVAKRYLEAKDENSQKIIREVFNNCNDNIRKILGV